jgi:hypothetical protein
MASADMTQYYEKFLIGYISRETYDEDRLPSQEYCNSWIQSERDDFFDSYWKTGMAFGIIAGYAGLIPCVFGFALFWVKLGKRAVKTLACVYALLIVASGLMLIGLASDICDSYRPATLGDQVGALHCEFGAGVYLSIVASILYLAATVLTLLLREIPELPMFGDAATQPVTRIHPDGTSSVVMPTAPLEESVKSDSKMEPVVEVEAKVIP